MRAVVAMLLVSSVAHADVNLAVQSAPPATPKRLTMRKEPEPARQLAQSGGSDAATLPAPGASPQREGGSGSWLRDIQQHVVFRLRAGVAVDAYPTDDPMLGGRRLADDPGDPALGASPLRETNSYLLGDAVVGSRGLPVASLNSYFQAQFRLNLGDGPENATHPDVWDSLGDKGFLLTTGYAEVDGYGKANHPLHPLFLRAGRQTHYGSAMIMSMFDGVQLGWHAADWQVGGFVGRRVALWQGDDPGILAGGNLRVRLERLVGVPLDVAADVMSFEGGKLFLESAVQVTWGARRFSVLGRMHSNGSDAKDDALGFDRVAARLRWPLNDRWDLRLDGAYITKHELSYDWLATEQTDVVDVKEGIAMTLPRGSDALRGGLSLSWQFSDSIELYGFGRASFSDDTGFDSSWVEGGGAARLMLEGGIAVSGQVKSRFHLLEDAPGAGSEFDDLTGTGVADYTELAADATYRPQRGAITGSVGAYLRRYSFRSPYVEVTGDTRGGVRADAQLALGKHAAVRGVVEAAQASPTLAPELGVVYSVRVLAEANF